MKLTQYKDCDETFVLEFSKIISFTAMHWEGSEATLKVVLSKKQVDQLMKLKVSNEGDAE